MAEQALFRTVAEGVPGNLGCAKVSVDDSRAVDGVTVFIPGTPIASAGTLYVGGTTAAGFRQGTIWLNDEEVISGGTIENEYRRIDGGNGPFGDTDIDGEFQVQPGNFSTVEILFSVYNKTDANSGSNQLSVVGTYSANDTGGATSIALNQNNSVTGTITATGATRQSTGGSFIISDSGATSGSNVDKIVVGVEASASVSGAVTTGSSSREVYGVRGTASGSSAGTSIAYGGWFTASGADTNFAIWAQGLTGLNGDVEVQGDVLLAAGAVYADSAMDIDVVRFGADIDNGLTFDTTVPSVAFRADGTNVLTFTSSLAVLDGSLRFLIAGNGIQIKEGANARMGVATLVGGTVTVNNTSVTNNTRIFLTHQNNSGTVGFVTVSTRTASTSFTILSSSATDTSDIAWLLVEPA